MQKIYFVVVGKIKESFYREAVAEYVKRLSWFAKVEIKELAEGADPEAEKGDILRACKGYVIALAVEGEKLSSEKLAKKLQKLTDEGKDTARVGGHSDKFRQNAKGRYRPEGTLYAEGVVAPPPSGAKLYLRGNTALGE